MTRFAEQNRIRLVSQLIKDNSRVLQKLLKLCNGAAISTFTVTASLVLVNYLNLNINNLEFLIGLLGLSV